MKEKTFTTGLYLVALVAVAVCGLTLWYFPEVNQISMIICHVCSSWAVIGLYKAWTPNVAGDTSPQMIGVTLIAVVVLVAMHCLAFFLKRLF